MNMRTSSLDTLLLLATIAVGICATATVAAWSLSPRASQDRQTREKVIVKAFNRKPPPVQIEEVKASQKPIELGQKFDAEDDWLNSVVLKARNSSGKAIVYLEVNINFPETRASGGMMSFPVVFGQMPGSKFVQKQDPIFFMAGDTLELPLAKHFSRIKSFVEHRTRIAELQKVELEIGFVVFADKTAWAAGDFLRQDPNNLDHYINTGDKSEPNQ